MIGRKIIQEATNKVYYGVITRTDEDGKLISVLWQDGSISLEDVEEVNILDEEIDMNSVLCNILLNEL